MLLSLFFGTDNGKGKKEPLDEERSSTSSHSIATVSMDTEQLLPVSNISTSLAFCPHRLNLVIVPDQDL